MSHLQVNTNALDNALNTIKKQLSRHEEELLHPVWMDALKSEIDKISGLTRKIEHCQLDINVIRNSTYAQAIEASGKSNMLELMTFLQGEVEALRLIVRRIELHQAVELMVFKEFKSMQKQVRKLEVKSDGDDTVQMVTTMKQDFENQMTELKDKVEELTDTVTNQERLILYKMNEMEKITLALKEKADSGADEEERSREILTLRTDLAAALALAKRAQSMAYKSCVKDGFARMQKAHETNVYYKLETAWSRWKAFTEDEVSLRKEEFEIRGKSLKRIGLKLFGKSGMIEAFDIWKRNIWRIKTGKSSVLTHYYSITKSVLVQYWLSTGTVLTHYSHNTNTVPTQN